MVPRCEVVVSVDLSLHPRSARAELGQGSGYEGSKAVVEQHPRAVQAHCGVVELFQCLQLQHQLVACRS